MERFIRYRIRFLIGFLVYIIIFVIGYSVYQGRTNEELLISVLMIILGLFAGVIECAIMSGKVKTKEYNYRVIMPVYFVLLFLAVVFGPIMTIILSSNGYELAGVVFVVTGMTLTSRLFLEEDKTQ